MKKLIKSILICCVISIFFATAIAESTTQLSQKQSAKAKISQSSEAIKLGQPIDQSSTVTIKELLDKIEVYVGKSVTIKGIVTEGCHHKGKWIRVSENKLHIDVFADNEWYFPTDHKNMRAIVTGIVKSEKLTGEALKRHIEHQNTEHGGKLDMKEYPEFLIQHSINATGAKLYKTPKSTEKNKAIKKEEPGKRKEKRDLTSAFK